MDYVIINGKKSTLVKGLLIQSLPMISKPLMRSSIEEIDGRAGDIVTKLGFAAYDRTMKIGLFGDFDIYEVINYFNSEGEAVFSNEIDKVYHYQILQQIDFEKLLRFRQANVVFHCQPFKYASTDEVAAFDNSTHKVTVINSGNVYSAPEIKLVDANGFATAKNLLLDGVTVASVQKPTGATSTESVLIINANEMKTTNLSDARLDRYITCDYRKLYLSPGKHTLECDYGDSISKFERWI